MTLPIGPEVDPWPRPLPARTPIAGSYVTLEPLHRRHAAELFTAAQESPEAFTYMSYGPFTSLDQMAKTVAAHAVEQNRAIWAIRPIATGLASGWISLMNIEPEHAAIELGHIWFGPKLQRTRAATEAMFLLLRRAADELGYRRLVWQCHALNTASLRAAERLGFVREGLLRSHRVVKGRSRDTAVFSIVGDEWPVCRDAMAAWLAPDNFGHDGSAKRGLASFRRA
jgi:RimJ/RimL family protein N-acetyltransferase